MTNEFGEWLARELARLNFSQRELGRRAGISSAHISQVVRGEKGPGYDFLASIAAPLGRTPLEMFQRAGKMQFGGEARSKYYAATMTAQEARFIEVLRQLSDVDRGTLSLLAVAMRDRQQPAILTDDPESD